MLGGKMVITYIPHHGYPLHLPEVVQMTGAKVYAQVESKLLYSCTCYVSFLCRLWGM